jgi:hypothetical protein
MNIYAVFVPLGLSPIKKMESIQFVKQGFDWEAFLITPLWAMRRGLWLALSLWIAALAATGLIAVLAQLSGAVAFLIFVLISLAFGMESDRFRQARLTNAGFLLQGLALGASLTEAETLYLSAGRNRSFEFEHAPMQGNARKRQTLSGSAGESDLLGLFPPGESKP